MTRMARPPLPLGTAGEIHVFRVNDKHQARCLFRDFDGKVREIARRGRTPTEARNRLREAIRDRGSLGSRDEITGDTLVKDLAELWLAEVVAADRSPTTVQQYRYCLDRYVIPGLGDLRLRELSVGRLDRLLTSIRERTTTKHRRSSDRTKGRSSAKLARTVLSGMIGLAVRHDALETNLVRDVRRIEGQRKRARALTLDEARDLRAKVHTSEDAARWDLIDFSDMMLGTGLRIGEVAAIVRNALNLDSGLVEVRGTVIRVKGVGLMIKPEPKSEAGWRTLELAPWTVEMLRARLDAVGEELPGDAVIFPAPLGGLRDPSNTQADLRVVFDAAGFEWVTSHVYRRTVATLMDEAGLSARAAADQLGHAHVSMTQDRYFGRRTTSTGAARVLQQIVLPTKGKD